MELVFDDTQCVTVDHNVQADVNFARIDMAETMMTSWTSPQLQRLGVKEADLYAAVLLMPGEDTRVEAELRIGVTGHHVTFTKHRLNEPMTFVEMAKSSSHNMTTVVQHYPAWLCAFSDAEQILNAVQELWTTRQRWLFAAQTLANSKCL